MPYSKKSKMRYEKACKRTLELYMKGYPLDKIAVKEGVSHGTIWRRLKSMGIRPDPNNNLADVSISIPKEEWKLGYMAGIIDGEGSIFFTKPGVQFKISVSNTSRELMEFLKRELREGVSPCSFRREKKSHLPLVSRCCIRPMGSFTRLIALPPN